LAEDQSGLPGRPQRDAYGDPVAHPDARGDAHEPTLSLRDAQKQLTRDRLVDAAFELFGRRGYEATNAEQIAKVAGTSRATFYLYFKTKAELVLELQARTESEVVNSYAVLDELVGSTRSDVRRWVEETLGVWERDRLRLAAMEQALAVEQRVADRWFEILNRAIDRMPRALGVRGERPEVARLRLLTMMFQIDRAMYFHVIRSEPLDREILVDVLADQWWAALQP
jgi:AcrR family transcriptional regulator